MKVYRKMGFSKIHYHIVNNKDCIGSSKYTFGIMPFKLRVESNSSLLELRQTPLFLKIINSLPILSLETFTPFCMYEDGKCIGQVKKILFKRMLNLKIYNQNYQLIYIDDHKYSLKQNDRHIAIFKKDNVTIQEKNTYNIECYSKIKQEFLLILCMLIDVVFYPNNLQISYWKIEKDM